LRANKREVGNEDAGGGYLRHDCLENLRRTRNVFRISVYAQILADRLFNIDIGFDPICGDFKSSLNEIATYAGRPIALPGEKNGAIHIRSVLGIDTLQNGRSTLRNGDMVAAQSAKKALGTSDQASNTRAKSAKNHRIIIVRGASCSDEACKLQPGFMGDHFEFKKVLVFGFEAHERHRC
jgi:hypothetical protein